MEKGFALRMEDIDVVATVFSNGITDGSVVAVRDQKGNIEDITVIGDVPYGHKIAVCDLKDGDKIMKYGECIGVACADIKKGEYVHVHNMKALRGRGDLEAKGDK